MKTNKKQGENSIKLSLAEQETIILWDRAGEEATVYTHEPTLKRRLAEIEKLTESVKLTKADGGSVEYTIPKKLVGIRKPAKKKILSSEEKQELTARLAASRKEK